MRAVQMDGNSAGRTAVEMVDLMVAVKAACLDGLRAAHWVECSDWHWVARRAAYLAGSKVVGSATRTAVNLVGKSAIQMADRLVACSAETTAVTLDAHWVEH